MATTPRKTTAGSRKPRPSARVASRPATTRPAVEPEDVFEEPDVTEAEAQEGEAVGKYVAGDLCGEEIRIIPPAAWRQSWQRLLNAGQVDAFAEIVVHPGDYDLYLDIDPTNEEFGELIGEAARLAGESLGKSSGPAVSSRRTRRR